MPEITHGRSWGLVPDRAAKTRPPLNYLDHPSQNAWSILPTGTLGLHSRPAFPKAEDSNPVAGGGWDPVSRPQPGPSFRTPTLAAGRSAQMARPGATLLVYFLSLA